MLYDIDKHRHNFAVWAAARAAQRGFSDVSTLRKVLEGSGVVEFLKAGNLDDIDATRFDAHHRRWCKAIVDSLKNDGFDKATFGRAAKLIAIYIKSVVVLGAHSETALARIAHPPIDAILLRKLAASREVQSEHQREWAKTKWTMLNCDDYDKLIAQLRKALGIEEPFWKLERFWTVTNDSRDGAAQKC